MRRRRLARPDVLNASEPVAVAAIVAIVVSLHLPNFAQGRPSGEEDRRKSSAVAIDRLERVLGGISDRVRGLREGADEGPESVETLAEEASARRLYEWVRDEVEFEPYDGAIRSPREVLAVRAANSVDQARLLAALYDERDIDYRWAFGRFGDPAEVGVLREFAGRAPTHDGSATTVAKLRSEHSSYARSEYRALLDGHVWLEVRTSEGEHRAADPSTGGAFGETRARARDRADELPDRFRARLRAELVASFREGPDRRLVTIAGPLSRFAYRPINLTFERPHTGKKSLVPRIRIAEQSRAGERFLPGDLEELRLVYDAEYGDREAHFERPLFVRGDEESRSFRRRENAASIVVVPGWASASRMAERGEERLRETTDRLRQSVEGVGSGEDEDEAETVDRIVSGVANAAALAYPLRADSMTGRLAGSMGVRPVSLEPRVVHAFAARGPSGVDVAVDVEGGGLTAVPRDGVSGNAVQGFLTLRGSALDRLRSTFVGELAGPEPPTVQRIVRLARSSDVPLVTLHPYNDEFVEKLDVDPRVRRRIAETISRTGRVALVPSRSIDVRGARVFGWWSTDPTTGALRGHHAGRVSQLFERSGAARGRIDGTTLERVVEVLDESIRNASDDRSAVCAGLPQLRFVGRALCGTGTRPLPSLSSCGDPGAGEAAPGSGIGEVGLRPARCEERVSQLRCGASAAQRLFGGGTTPRMTPEGLPSQRRGLPGTSLPSAETRGRLTCHGG